ncbi:MAG: hypothetical protein H7321_00980 [Bacteroidia bacterium]|nr:hypothetical protein [Bacteroidia bacterium]
MKNQIKIRLVVAAIAGLLIASQGCKGKDPIPAPPNNNETELITTVTLIFTDSANSNDLRFATFNDPDGEGGNGPTQFDTVKLKANSTYTCEILLLDKSKNPVDTVSNQVKKENNDHQFFFHTHIADVEFNYLDFDTHTPPLPVGLSTKWRTKSAGKGYVHVILKHQPDVKNGTLDPGETDAEVEFPIVLE